MIVVTDILREPFDEGAKVATLNILKKIKMQGSTVVSVNGEGTLDLVDSSFRLNKMLMNFRFYKALRAFQNNKILYIPEASITPLSMIRARLMQLFTCKKVIILAFQPRKYGLIAKVIIRMARPVCVITQSKKTFKYLKKVGINSRVIPLGFDEERFKPENEQKKSVLRDKYSIECDKPVILHVGHIQESRNLEWFIQIKKNAPDITVLIVGSTYQPNDKRLYETLIDSGIIIFKEYLPEIEEIYNLADVYIFPVLKDDAAIGMPLSVLEAMACNLPIITTRFGNLADVFSEDECFHFVSSSDDIIDILKYKKLNNCNNRVKIEQFTWSKIANQLMEMMESS